MRVGSTIKLWAIIEHSAVVTKIIIGTGCSRVDTMGENAAIVRAPNMAKPNTRALRFTSKRIGPLAKLTVYNWLEPMLVIMNKTRKVYESWC